MDIDASLLKLAIGSFRSSSVRSRVLHSTQTRSNHDQLTATLAGYSTYAWAKKHDAYLNSKEGHLAQAGEH